MEKITQTIPYKLQFTDTARFIASSSSNRLDNTAEGIHKIKCTNILIMKNVKHVEISAKIVSAILNTQTLKTIQ